jgi:predicted PurR-regulated permease PerM
MAPGTQVPSRHLEPDHAPEEGIRRFSPGLTPVSLFLVLMLFWVLTKTGLVLVLGLLALVLGTILEGPVRRLEERRFPRGAAIATVYAALIGVIALLVVIIVPIIRDQGDEFQEQIPAQLEQLEADWAVSSNPLLSGPGSDLLRTGIDFFNQPGGSVSPNAAERAIPIVTSVGTTLVATLSLFVITFYYLLEKRLIRRVIISQLSPSIQPRVSRLWEEVENKVGGWIRGQLILCLIIGTIATISYGIVGLSFWPLLGLWAGITEIIPIVGPWIGGIPAVIVALTQGWQTALVVGLIIIGMQTLENWFLVPRVMRGAVGLTPLTVFLAILAGTQLMGVPGAVLAIPIAATIQVIITDFLDQRRLRLSSEETPMSGWRWMLSRGIGRDQHGDVAPLMPEDDAEQIESEPVYPGPQAPPSAETEISDPEHDVSPDPDENAMVAGASPPVPWSRQRRSTSTPSPWRGTPHAKKPPAGAATPKPSDKTR